MSNEKINPNGLDLKEKIVHIRRVAKVTKGGKRFHFTALVVIGNEDGIIGSAIGKSNEVPNAIKKAIDKAKKKLIRVPRKGHTIPHEIIGEHSSSRIMLKPAGPGTGVIAGGAVRAVIELSGIGDILSKVMGSTNPINVVNATIQGLSSLSMADEIAAIRDKQLSELDIPAAR